MRGGRVMDDGEGGVVPGRVSDIGQAAHEVHLLLEHKEARIKTSHRIKGLPADEQALLTEARRRAASNVPLVAEDGAGPAGKP